MRASEVFWRTCPRRQVGRNSSPMPRLQGCRDLITITPTARPRGVQEDHPAMHRSTDRILTTHVGSLIRPDVIRRHLRAKQKGEGYDAAAHARGLKETVAEVVRKQAEIGVDVVSDGEFGKGISWSQYVIERVDGFERRPFNPATGNPFTKGADRTRFPEFYQELDAKDHVETITDTVAVAPIEYTGQALIQQDIDNFKDALKQVK